MPRAQLTCAKQHVYTRTDTRICLRPRARMHVQRDREIERGGEKEREREREKEREGELCSETMSTRQLKLTHGGDLAELGPVVGRGVGCQGLCDREANVLFSAPLGKIPRVL